MEAEPVNAEERWPPTTRGPYAAVMPPASGTIGGSNEAHGSNLIELPTGDILLTWFSGVEGSSGVGIVVARLNRDSRYTLGL